MKQLLCDQKLFGPSSSFSQLDNGPSAKWEVILLQSVLYQF